MPPAFRFFQLGSRHPQSPRVFFHGIPSPGWGRRTTSLFPHRGAVKLSASHQPPRLAAHLEGTQGLGSPLHLCSLSAGHTLPSLNSGSLTALAQRGTLVVGLHGQIIFNFCTRYFKTLLKGTLNFVMLRLYKTWLAHPLRETA